MCFSVSSLLLCFCGKYHDQSNERRKKFISSYAFQSVIQGSRGRSLGRDNDERKAVYGLACSGSVAFYRPTCLGMAPPKVVQTLLHELVIKSPTAVATGYSHGAVPQLISFSAQMCI